MSSGMSARGAATVETFAGLADRILAAPARLGTVRLVAIDGPSGAGKTWFAGRLAAALGSATGTAATPRTARGVAVPVVHTDDLLDGWDDQLTFWDRLEEQVLDPLRHGRPARYRRYLWHRKRFGGVPVVVEPTGVVVLEGVTAARAAIRPELSLAVFVTAPADLRLRRALDRDADGGDLVALRAYLERWRVVEDRHFVEDSTAVHADLVVDGAAQPDGGPARAHDAEDRFVRSTVEHERT
jgi:uridine kinase